jgi:hypothetical protein
VVVMGYSFPASHPFPELASGQIFKDDVNGFSATSDICFMLLLIDDHSAGLGF